MPRPALCREIPGIAVGRPASSSRHRHNSRTAALAYRAGDCRALTAQAGRPPAPAPALLSEREPEPGRECPHQAAVGLAVRYRGRSHRPDVPRCVAHARPRPSSTVLYRVSTGLGHCGPDKPPNGGSDGTLAVGRTVASASWGVDSWRRRRALLCLGQAIPERLGRPGLAVARRWYSPAGTRRSADEFFSDRRRCWA